MSATDTTTRVKVNLPTQDHEVLRAMAYEERSSVSAVVRRAVRRLLNTKHAKSVAEKVDARNG